MIGKKWLICFFGCRVIQFLSYSKSIYEHIKYKVNAYSNIHNFSVLTILAHTCSREFTEFRAKKIN
jgi:hypothetical protein